MAADALYVINHVSSRITRVNPWVYSIAFGVERAKKGRRAGKQDGRRSARFFSLFVITCTCSGSCNTQESKIIASTGDTCIHAQTQRYPPGFSSVLRAGDAGHFIFLDVDNHGAKSWNMCVCERKKQVNKIERDIYISRERKREER